MPRLTEEIRIPTTEEFLATDAARWRRKTSGLVYPGRYGAANNPNPIPDATSDRPAWAQLQPGPVVRVEVGVVLANVSLPDARRTFASASPQLTTCAEENVLHATNGVVGRFTLRVGLSSSAAPSVAVEPVTMSPSFLRCIQDVVSGLPLAVDRDTTITVPIKVTLVAIVGP